MTRRLGVLLVALGAYAPITMGASAPITPGAHVPITPGAHAPGQEAIEREWNVRGWAHEGLPLDLRGALTGSAWSARAAAHDAARRALAAGGELPQWIQPYPRSALQDPSLTVRVRALEVLRSWGRMRLQDPVVEELARIPLPAVRLALARAVERSGDPSSAAGVLALVDDEDERVAAAALRALCARGGRDDAERDLLVARAASFEENLLIAVAEWLLRSDPAPELLARLRAARTDDPALFEALSYAKTGGGDPERLLAGWARDGEWNPRRQAVLLAAARSGDEGLARRWLTALDGLPKDAELAYAFADAVLLCVVPRRVTELCLELALTPETIAFLLPRIGQSIVAWEGDEILAWLDPGADPGLRRAAIEALAYTLSLRGDPAAGERLLRALNDPEATLSALAFRALCDVEDPAPWAAGLHAAWLALGENERLRRLGWLPRGVRLAPFRDDLLRMGADPDARRRAATELLAAFEQDAAVREELSAWLTDDLDRFLVAEEGTARAVELRVQGEVRALSAVDAVDAVPALILTLERSLGRSTEIGKTAAAALGRSSEGRDKLPGFLGDEIDLRTRIEAAIALAQHGPRSLRAVSVLIADYDAAAWDLRTRMVAGLGRSDREPAAAFLARLTLDEGRPSEDRIGALGALAELETPEVTRVIGDVARDAKDLEVRRAAIRALGGLDTEAARAGLLVLLDEVEAWVPVTPEASERRSLLRGELLGALGEARALPPRVLAAWLRGPAEAAAGDLEARFRGEAPAAAAFRWPGELALAKHLAASGETRAALEASPDWPRLDGRLLVALAGEVLAGGDEEAARALYSAAVVALLGEAEPPPEELARARCRLLGLLWSRGEWSACARLAENLRADHRAGRIPATVWVEAFGFFDRVRGTDPTARLASAALQARAWSALEQGEPDLARALWEEAEGTCGISVLARAEQSRLKAALDAR